KVEEQEKIKKEAKIRDQFARFKNFLKKENLRESVGAEFVCYTMERIDSCGKEYSNKPFQEKLAFAHEFLTKYGMIDSLDRYVGGGGSGSKANLTVGTPAVLFR